MRDVGEKLSARERITTLLDNHSFVEIGAHITKRNTDYNLLEEEAPSDGVITGYGLIENELVYVYSQDASVLYGSIGEMHARKIVHIYDLARKVGAPVIGLVDCAGIRLQEGLDALDGFGAIYRTMCKASGWIPQLTAIFGRCGGGLAVLSSLSDFTFMEGSNATLFVNTPNALTENHKDLCDTSTSSFHAKNGLIDFVVDGETALLHSLRNLITILPHNNQDINRMIVCEDDLNRMLPSFASSNQDSLQVLKQLSDSNFVCEVKEAFAQEMTTAFIRLNGVTVGAIANRLVVFDEGGEVKSTFDGRLTTQGCEKAAQFVAFCDAYRIPILTLTNVKGYEATIEEEQTIAIATAKLTYAFATATVPKVNLIVGDAIGSAYVTMNSKQIGADFVLATEQARIGIMDATSAVKIMYQGENKNVSDGAKERETFKQTYEERQLSALSAAKRGYIDRIIESPSARKEVIYAFEMLANKCEVKPNKKHRSFS